MGWKFVEADVAIGLDDIRVVEISYSSVWIHGHQHRANVRLPRTYTRTHTNTKSFTVSRTTCSSVCSPERGGAPFDGHQATRPHFTSSVALALAASEAMGCHQTGHYCIQVAARAKPHRTSPTTASGSHDSDHAPFKGDLSFLC